MTLSDTPAYFSVRDIHAYYGESYFLQCVTIYITSVELLALLGLYSPAISYTFSAIARFLATQCPQALI